MVLVPVRSVPQVTLITGSESVVPDRASSSEQCSSRRPLEPAIVTDLFLSYGSTIGPAVDQLTLVLREASRDL